MTRRHKNNAANKQPSSSSSSSKQQQPTSSSSSLTPRGAAKGTDSPKSIIGSPLSHGSYSEKVPSGLFYWFQRGQTPIFLLMDHHGELFLIQKGRVFWSHKTNLESYSLFVSPGVKDFVDSADDMFPHRHIPGQLTPEVISHDGSLKHLLEKLKIIYGKEIRLTRELYKFELDYQTGELSEESTSERFVIDVIKYDILLSSLEPPTLRWHLVFAHVSAAFPSTDFPCMVLYARSLNQFIKICQDFNIESLPGGRDIKDLIWMEKYRTKLISVSPEVDWEFNTAAGLYEDVIVLVIRVKRTAGVTNIIEKLRRCYDNENLLHFYGWQEGNEYDYLAFEMCKKNLEDVVHTYNFTGDNSGPLRLDILIGIARGVLSLQGKGINHGKLTPKNVFVNPYDIAKLGPSRFVFEEENDDKGCSLNTNMHDLAKILLFLTSGGSYTFSDQAVGEDDLNLCKSVEARDVIKKIISMSIVTLSDLLRHPFFWGAIKRLSFIVDFSEHMHAIHHNAPIVLAADHFFQVNKVYNKRWNRMNKNLLSDMEAYRVKWNLSPYNYTEVRSLVRFTRNAFNHHRSFSKQVYIDIGYNKLHMLAHFETTCPGFVLSLHEAGLSSDPSAIPNFEIYYIDQ